MKLIMTSAEPPIEYLLFGDTTSISATPEADITLPHSTTIPFHVLIRQESGMFSIRCLNPDAKVYVNDFPIIQGQTLWPGDRIKLGTTQFIFQKDDVVVKQEPVEAPTAQTPAESEPVSLSTPTLLSPENRNELRQLKTFDPETLEMLRRESPALRPATGLSAFLHQGLSHANGGQGKGIFGLLLALPALSLTIYQKVREKFSPSEEEAFPEGTWQFYTQFGLREDPARHANETEGFHRSIPEDAGEVDQAAAWVHQCITTLFEYEALIENEWVERTLLRLVHEAIASSVVEQLAMAQVGPNIGPNSAEVEALKAKIRKEEIERIELETEQIKQNLKLSDLAWQWVKERPYRRLSASAHETYPQYRRKIFLEFLARTADKLPSQMGALIWERYHELSSTALPAYQAQMSILYALRPDAYQDRKSPIPLWQAQIGFVFKGRYYLFDVAHHDAQGRPLVFKPGKPEDPGEPLLLTDKGNGELEDQQGRQVAIDRRGEVTITEKGKESRVKVLRPTPASVIKAQLAAILKEAESLPPATTTTDLILAQAARPKQAALVSHLPELTQLELALFDFVPIIINWDVRDRRETLHKIRSSHRGIGNHALTIFRTKNSFVFEQSHIFYDAIWGMMISQIITDGAIETYHHLAKLRVKQRVMPVTPLRLTSSPAFHTAAQKQPPTVEVTAETETVDLPQINRARKCLAALNIPITVNDFLTFFRSLHDQRYAPSLILQQRLLEFRLAGHGDIIDLIETDWRRRKTDTPSLLLPMDASFIDPKLRLFPATFRNFLPDFLPLYERATRLLDEMTYHPSPGVKKEFGEVRGQLMANLMVLVEYFNMLKQITRQGDSLSTAAIKYLAHLPPGMQGTLDLIPQHIGALNEILKGEEVFSNVGRVAPTSSLVRFMSAKDDGASKVMVWGIMCDRQGILKITLRDFRPHVARMLDLTQESLAQLITADYLEAYARGLNQFAEDLATIASVA